MVKSGTLGAILPQSVVHSVRMNMDLADIIHLDTLNRTSAAIDGLGAKSSGTEVSGAFFRHYRPQHKQVCHLRRR